MNLVYVKDWKRDLTMRQPQWRSQMSRAYDEVRKIAAKGEVNG